MLPQTARLRKARDFKEVFEKGRGVKEGRLFLKTRAVQNRDVRIGIVVSKQVAVKAVDRNRIKRLLREALKSYLPSIREGHDVIIVTLPGFAVVNLQDAKAKVISIIKKISLLNP